ncbi:MAG: gliding motility-associated C-terminal domain-containing protein [Cyclobacteriaceae bacterium]|nr:gliding motility-associated C-terminal domain-containing protein [Cyclobacteriaceae bacterium]
MQGDAVVNGVVQAPGTITYEWYKGDNTLPANLVATTSGTNGQIVNQVAGGGIFYTLKVKTALNCTNTTKLAVTENVNQPVITFAITPNGVCDPLLGTSNYNGQVDASLTLGGVAVTDFTPYQFVWHSGSLATDPVIAGATTASLTQRNGGSYTLVATRTDLGCTSVPTTAVVTNAPVLPQITDTPTPSTTCAGTPNGAISVVITVGATTTTNGYTFSWFNGNSIASPAVAVANGGNTHNIFNVAGGSNYTVQARNNVTGCVNTSTIALADNKIVPVLALTAHDNDHCSALAGFTGSITSTVTDVNGPADNHNFIWSTGNTMASPIGGQSAATLAGIDGGFYTATVTNTVLQCTSAPITVQVLNNQVLPVINATPTPSTNCAGTGNGTIAAVVNTGAGTTTTGYTFAWFQGNNTAAPAVAPASGGTSATAIHLTGGQNFTVQVTNSATGCASTQTITLDDNKALPVLTLTPTINDVCDALIGFTGSISSSVTDTNGPANPHVYTWSSGLTMAAPIAGQTSATLAGINGGFYTATVTNSTLQCTSAPVTVQVLNQQVLPTLTTSVTGSTNCDPALKNGVASLTLVNGVAPGASFTYAWYAGNTVAGAAIGTNAVLNGVQGGAASTYTLEVTTVSTGCKNTETLNVPDNSVLPVLSINTTSNSVCDPTKTFAGTTYNGQAVVSVSNIGTGVLSDYDFTWSTGLTGAGQNTLNNSIHGAYTVSAKQTSTGCQSSVYAVNIMDTRVLPTITTSSVGSTNCNGGTPNGSVSVTSVTPLGQTYAYAWYDGNVVAGGVKSNASTYSGVQGGLNGVTPYQYTVQVRILETGCENEATQTVADDSTLPLIDPLAHTDNTFCVGGNGSASVTGITYQGAPAAPGFAGFSFTWSNGDSGPSTTTGMIAGNYTVTATQLTDNCKSNPVSVNIADNLFIPVIKVAKVSQSSCDPLNPNGQLTATVDETTIGGGASMTAGYTFEWVNNGNPFATPGILIANTSLVGNLAGNKNYTVTATRSSTGCVHQQAVFLDENIVLPTATLTVLSNQTFCNPPDGSLQATVVPAPSLTYTYYWLKETPGTTTTSSATVISTVNASSGSPNRKVVSSVGGDTDVAPDLSYGNYTFVAVDDQTSCISQPVTATVLDQTNPNFNITVNTNPSTCGAGDGDLDLNAVRADGVATTFSFDLHKGGPTNAVTPINFYSNPPVFDGAIDTGTFPATFGPVAAGANVNVTAIPSSTYTVVATDGFGCQSLHTFFLDFVDAPSISSTLTDSDLCPYTIGNGSVDANVVLPVTGPVTTPDQYIIRAYRGGNADLTKQIGTDASPVAPLFAPQNYSSLAPGFYTLEVEQNFGSHCTVLKVVEIKSLSLSPILDLVGAITPNDACSAASYNGQIQLSVNPDPADLNPSIGTVTYTITENAAAFQAAVAAGNYTASNRAPGDYTYLVTASTGCTTSRTYTIQDNPVVAQLNTADVAVTDAAYCTPALERSASVQVSAVRLSSGSSEQMADYQFDWYTDPDLTANIHSALGTAGGKDLINDLPAGSGTVPAGTVVAGDYYIQVTKMADASGTGGLGCLSAPFTVTIEDNKVRPSITLTPDADTSCDPAFFEGQITVDVTTATGPGSGGTYTYAWTPNGGTGQPVNSVNNSGVANVQTNVNDGTFTLKATNETTGCFASLSTTLLKDTPPLFVLSATPTPLSNCLTQNGKIDVSAITLVPGGAGVLNDYDYVWYKTSPATVPVLDGTVIAADQTLDITSYPALVPGFYYVKSVRKSGTGAGAGCESAPLKLEIRDNRAYPTAVATTVSNTSCNNNFDGQIGLTPTTTDANGVVIPGPYDFNWTVKPAAATITNVSGTATYTYQAGDLVGAGTYVSRITNNTNGCFTDFTVFLQQNSVPVTITTTSTTPLTRCDISDGTASVLVNGTKVNGNPEPLADFSFLWKDASNVTVGNTATASGLTTGTFTVMITKTNVSSPGSGCSSVPVRVSVGDLRANPVIGLSSIASTSCNTNYDGQISVTASTTDPNGATIGGPYNYTWTSQPAGTTITGGAFAANYGYQVGDLVGPGAYGVRVTNQTNGCFVDGTITVQQNTVPVAIIAGTSTPLNNCVVSDGTATVTSVTVDGLGEATTDFSYSWADNVGNPVAVGSTASGLGSGDFFVTATKTAVASPASGCLSPPFKVTVSDNRENPTVTFSIVSNTACDSNFDGQISVLANNVNAPGAGSNYDYTWTLVPAGSTVANALNAGSNYATGAPDVVGPGTYTVRVTNRTTQCFNDATTSLFTNKTPVQILTVNKADQMICNPDGSISISTLKHGVATDYTYQWFRTSPTTAPLTDAALATITADNISAANYPTMGAGTYFVVATRKPSVAPGSGCATAPFRVDIKDLHTDPLIAFTFQPNSTCDPTIANGTALATATEVSGATGDTYTFAWTFNGAGLPAATTQTDATATSQLAQAFDGDYTLTATNTTGTGCSATASLTIDLNQDVSKPNIINLTTVDPVDCLPTGSGQVSSISIGGGAPITGAALATSFSYEWYKTSFTPASQVPAQTSPTLNGILPDDYFVLVKDLTTQCKSTPRQFTIGTGSIVLPVVDITQPVKQISCNPAIGLAVLDGTADGQTDANANYQFSWFNSQDGTGPLQASTSTFSGLKTGTYSMTVKNITTNCSNTTFYVVPDESAQFTAATSVTGAPLTFCVGQDGAVLIRAVNIDPTYPFTYSYKADLYFSGTPNLGLPPDITNVPNVPGFLTSFEQTGLGIGTYTARLTDNNTGCFSTATGVIDDNRVKPLISVVQDTPMTNCDPVIANGQLSALADGSFIDGYSFNWYAGLTVPVAGAPLSTQNKLIGQTAGDYVVRVTKLTTGCFDDLAGQITDATVLPFAPTVTVLGNRTSCITPNGSLGATVNGSLNYIFNWYNGSTASGTPALTDFTYASLDVATYAVTATDPVTRCVSPARTADILDERVIPEFKLKATPSYCLDSGREPIGTIILEATSADYVLQDALWTDVASGASAGIGGQVTGLYPGEYEVLATTIEGCTNTGRATIETEIAPYNGISLNGDGKNDSFIVDCISLFPNNNVKIFNRNGILVFEANGYNNSDISFKGLGESGLYTIGNHLPDGTYYYIIDKGDGSKPVAGYLELMR